MKKKIVILWIRTLLGQQPKKVKKVIRYNNYLYHLKRENKNSSSVYVCTFKWCFRTISLKRNVIIKSNDENHNHEPKLPENVQTVFCGLKRRVLSDIDQSVTKIYEELKKIVSVTIKRWSTLML